MERNYYVESKKISLTIVCTVNSGKPEETLELQTNESTIQSGVNGRLEYTFVPTRKNNRQSFKCSAISEILDNPLVYTIDLDINKLNSFPDKPDLVIPKINPPTLVEGRSTQLCCRAYGNPNIQIIEWKKNGESVLNDSDSNLCLEFISLNRSDAGNYTCKATNSVGQSVQSMIYKILYPPVINITRLPIEQKIILTCNPRGEPNNYTFADWEHLSEFKEYIRSFPGTKDGKLTIVKAVNNNRRHENDGIYTCKSTNGILDVHRDLYQKGSILINDEGPPIFVKANKPIQFGQYRQEIDLTAFLYNTFGNIQTNIAKENKTLNTQTTKEKIVTNDVFHNINVSVNGIKITFKIVLDNTEDFNDYKITACNEKGCNAYMVMIKSARFDGGFSQTFVIEYKTESEEMWRQTEPVMDNLQHTMTYLLYDISPNTRYYVQVLSKNRIGQCTRNETDFTLVLSLGLATHGYAVTVVAIVVPIIFILVLTIVMRVIVFIRNKGDSVENQLYQSSSFQNSAVVHHVLIQNETYQNLPALSNDNQTHQMRLYNGNGANGQSVSNSNRSVLSPVYGLEGNLFILRYHGYNIGESSLQYAEVTFKDEPMTQEVVIHGIADRTIYSDIDFMTKHVEQPCSRSESDSESDDDFMYVDGIENFVEKEEITI
ncbi:unnamed protein product [Mytilus edulis]|uniref:Ig-like domain-containing protein n=1 Tax=Mytilus edulis TaxID=6550 RepID=A0A8S3V1Y6_MYTED|nr:unnamed protein product [Mytilus edulis]